jgi:hypothetical protein
MKWIGLIAVVLLATLACKSPPPPEPVEPVTDIRKNPFPEEVWKRADGSLSSEHEYEFARDEALCNAPTEAEAERREGFDVRWHPFGGKASSQVEEDWKVQQREYRACMAERGWVRLLVYPGEPGYPERPDTP